MAHKVKDSFQQGLREERMVLVFCLVSFFGSGMSLSFTYGSDKPFGSIGIRFLPSPTWRKKKRQKISEMKNLAHVKKSRSFSTLVTSHI